MHVLLLGFVLLLCVSFVGCGAGGSGERIMAPEAEAAKVKPQSREQRVDHQIKMLGYEDTKKVKRAIYWLEKWGAESAKAIPALEETAKAHEDADVKAKATAALKVIRDAQAGGSPEEG